jgi:hypothetical protein
MASDQTCREIGQQNSLVKIRQPTQIGIFMIFGLIEESIEVFPDKLGIHCETISPQRVVQFLTKRNPSINRTMSISKTNLKYSK